MLINVCNVISDKNIGGAGKCILTFLKYHSKDKINLTIVLPKGSLLIPKIQELNGNYIEIDGLGDKSLDLSCIGKLKKIFRELKPDIIHTHAAMSAKIAGKIYSKAKIVYTRHSVFEPSPLISKGIGKIINGAVNNFLSDRIVAVADAAKKNLTDTGICQDKVTVIKNGVEPISKLSYDIISEERKKYGVNDDEFLIGIAARLTEVKGHTIILDALKMLRDDHMNVKLIIAGTGEYEDNIRKKIDDLNLNQSVIMTGFINDITKFMNILDLNVNASFGTEATSLSLLEGLSIGLPCVVSDFGGNPGVVYDGVNGFLFESKNHIMMYEKIKRIVSDKNLLLKLRNGAKEVFEKEFKAEIMTERTENLYYSALEDKR